VLQEQLEQLHRMTAVFRAQTRNRPQVRLRLALCLQPFVREQPEWSDLPLAVSLMPVDLQPEHHWARL
jgi:hypothetical protein